MMTALRLRISPYLQRQHNWGGGNGARGSVYVVTEVLTSPHGLTAIAATDMEMPEGKQQPPKADLHEAVLWYLRSKAKHLPTEEMHEFVSWLRRSPANASALLRIAEEDRRV